MTAHSGGRWKVKNEASAGAGRGPRAGFVLSTEDEPLSTGAMLLALHKPYGVLSQFTPEPGSKWRTLADCRLPRSVYPLGRLDADSEGLLLLSDEPGLSTRLLDPEAGHAREYWVQVEGVPSDDALQQLARGVTIAGYATRPCRAWRLEPAPTLPPRVPPIRVRQSIPDTWIAIELTEGKNRQVRRMTAKVGFPTLRLVRAKIGGVAVEGLAPGAWREIEAAALWTES